MWLLLAGCRQDPEPSPGSAIDWGEPVTTLTRRVSSAERLPSPMALDPAFPEGLAAALDLDLGGFSEGDGEPHRIREDLGAAGARPDRRSIALIFHQSDAQVADAESPTRVAALDDPSSTESAARPQELYALHALDALIRTMNALSVDHPIDFALVSGDNADSAQTNETDWFLSVWDGVSVHPDSGTDDAQADSDGNDPIAPFEPVGAEFPWYTVAGNHDVLVQGNFATPAFVDTALGVIASGGTRDLRQPGGPLAFQTAAADPARALLDRTGLVTRYLGSVSDPPGHGFTAENAADGTAWWSASPVPGLRLLGLDSNPDGPGSGGLSVVQRDTFLVPALDAAVDAGELVIVTSHYALGGLAIDDDGGTVGDLLLGYPNVVLSVVGHSHQNRVRAWGDGPGFWEIETSATVDWPGQGRLIELVDNGDGTLSVYGTMVDPLAPEGTMAARSRALQLVDWQAGWRVDDGEGTPDDRNVELVVPIPPGVTPIAGRARVDSLVLP